MTGFDLWFYLDPSSTVVSKLSLQKKKNHTPLACLQANHKEPLVGDSERPHLFSSWSKSDLNKHWTMTTAGLNSKLSILLSKLI